MEFEILDTIIERTRGKLSNTDTEINILDLLQSYDNYISEFLQEYSSEILKFLNLI